MTDATYIARRQQLATYFDETASEAWARLTSDAPVSGIRATVRRGRGNMRATLLSWLPDDLHGTRILDAGCGTGAFAVAAAKRGADVLAIDVAASLLSVAEERTPAALKPQIEYVAGDMLAPEHGTFDHVVAMDSLIHYSAMDIASALGALATRTHRSMVFTVAPATPALRVMHGVGRLFPRGDRAPAIVPISPKRLPRLVASDERLTGWQPERRETVSAGFYISHGMELVRR